MKPNSNVEHMLSNAPHTSNNVSENFWCDKCKEPLKHGSRNNVFFQSKILHPQCFVCETCQAPLISQQFLETHKKAFCLVHYALFCTQGFAAFTGDLSGFSFSVSCPATYQIAGYNIHPAIQCTANHPVPRQIPVRVQLYDETLRTMVKCGFQMGDSKLICEGTSCVKFTHLKLNKLKPIKRELSIQTFVPLDHNFKLQLIIGTRVIFSTSFQVVTTVAHLPPSQRESLRPSILGRNKKRKLYEGNIDATQEASAVGMNLKEEMNHEEKRHHQELRTLESALDDAILNGDGLAAKEYATELATKYKDMRENVQNKKPVEEKAEHSSNTSTNSKSSNTIHL